jgi:tRNA (Thr-GGU) A37 N-methylase
LAIEAEGGHPTVDAIDAFDGTPVLDVKPWLASVDVPPGYHG